MANITEKKAQEIYDRAIVIDGMAGTTYAIDGLCDSGVTAANITLAAHNEDFMAALDMLKNYYAFLQAYPERLLVVHSVADIERAKAEGKVGLIFGFQTGSPVEYDLTNLWLFARLGVRVIQLTYIGRNKLGYGCLEPVDEGLTHFGKKVVLEMNKMGILVDLSHCGWKTAADAIAVSQRPVVFSHSNPYAKTPITRNLPDELIKAAAATGGVIGINGHPRICATRPGVHPNLDDFMDCLDYMVQVAGVDHVGIGPDLFQGFTRVQEVRWHTGEGLNVDPVPPTDGMALETDLRSIAPALARRGYSELDMQKILGLNFLRVFREVWTEERF